MLSLGRTIGGLDRGSNTNPLCKNQHCVTMLPFRGRVTGRPDRGMKCTGPDHSVVRPKTRSQDQIHWAGPIGRVTGRPDSEIKFTGPEDQITVSNTQEEQIAGSNTQG